MTTNTKVHAVARVQIIVEIDCNQPWGDAATIAEVHQMASDEALDYIRCIPNGRLRVVGKPRVEAIIVPDRVAR
jgi:hypothetical protein